MRLLLLLLRNVVALALVLVTAPLRALRIRARPAYVRIRLKGDPPYRLGPRRRLLALRRPEPATVQSIHALRRELGVLSLDRRVKGIVLELQDFRAPAAKRQAIAELVTSFRARGKEVVGYAVSADTVGYELLCACGRIALAPAGRLELTGFSAEASALGVGLRKLGVAAHFVRRGEHKTAPELFTHDEVSEIQRRTLETILDERYRELLSIIAQGRGISPEEASRKVDGGPYSARRALAEGLVDLVVSEADLGKELASGGPAIEREPPEASIEGFDFYRTTRLFPPHFWKPLRPKERLSVVPISGIITHGDGGWVPIGPSIAGSDSVARALRSAGRARSRAALLYVSSPGGSAIASELILEEIKRLAKKKPVVAYFDRVAASGGYMAALGAKEIWAAPQAIAGSIGVFAGKFDVSGLLERLGVRTAVVARGEHSAIYSPTRPFSAGEREALERDVEETYQAFLQHVSAARGLNPEELLSRAEGRIYSGRAAMEAGLVDRTGSFDEACRRALALAGREPPEYDIVLHGPIRRRLSAMSLLTAARASALWALWEGWLGMTGLEAPAELSGHPAGEE